MNKLFPTMFSKPEKTQIIATVPFLVWVFVLVPMFMPFLADGLWEQGAISVWFEIGYHILNGVVMLFIAFSYLKDEWFMFTTDLRFYLKHIALTLGLIVGVELILLDIVWLCDLNVIAMLE